MNTLEKIKKQLNKKQRQIDIPTELELLNLITNIYNYKLSSCYILALSKIIESDNIDVTVLLTNYLQFLKTIMLELEQTLYNHIASQTYRFDIKLLTKYIAKAINKKLEIRKDNSIDSLKVLGLNVYTAIKIPITLPAMYSIDINTNAIAINPNIYINRIISLKDDAAALFYKMVECLSKCYCFKNASDKPIDELEQLKDFVFYHKEIDNITATEPTKEIYQELERLIPNHNTKWIDAINKYIDTLPPPLIINAINETAEAGIKDYRYFKAICSRYIENDYKTLSDIKNDYAEHIKERQRYNDFKEHEQQKFNNIKI